MAHSSRGEQWSVPELVDHAVQMAQWGTNQQEIGFALGTIISAGFDGEEGSIKTQLVQNALARDDRWRALFPEQSTPLHPIPASVAAGKQPVGEDTAHSDRLDEVTQTLREMQATMARLMTENQRLLSAQYNSPITTRNPLAESTRRPIKIPDPEPFNGKRKNFQMWKMQMEAKLAHDGDAVGSGTGYIFNRTKDKAATVVMSWLKRKPEGTPKELWEFLTQQFGNKLEAEQARRKLFTTMQGKQHLEDFNADFMQLAFDAGEDGNTDLLKARYRTAIRPDLQTHMVAIRVGEDWSLQDLMDRVVEIEENLFRAKMGQSYPKRKPVGDSDQMDWAPAGAYNIRSNIKQAKWVSFEERKRRRENNQCLRCGSANHYVNKCAWAPPAKATQITAAKVVEIDSDGSTSDENNSGKE
jgi:hypothetical protein